MPEESELTKIMVSLLNKEKHEGERNADFEERIWKDFKKVIDFDN